ncbi:hypothetical protein PCE1_003480 [Barthelona sp. PCE]
MEKRALVCGGASGIGQAFALALANRGYHVTITTRSKERAQSLDDADYRNGRVTCIMMDCSKSELWENLQSKFDIYVISTGNLEYVSALEAGVDHYQRAFEAHLNPVIHLSNHLAQFCDEDKADIYLLGSELSHEAVPDCAPYVVAKHALLGLYRSLEEDIFHRPLIKLHFLEPPDVRTNLWPENVLATVPMISADEYVATIDF